MVSFKTRQRSSRYGTRLKVRALSIRFKESLVQHSKTFSADRSEHPIASTKANRVKGDEFAKGQNVLFTDVEVPEAETNNVEFALAAQSGPKVA